MSVWQSEEQRCAVVLREVFAWLAGGELARCAAVCRAWGRAAADPMHWRRLLRRESLPPLPREAWWRQEYVRAHAGWRLAARYAVGAGASLLHGALAERPGGAGAARLALGCDDASVSVWARGPRGWEERGRAALRRRGWAAVARVHWPAATDARLLVAGPLALVPDWELLVLSVEEDGSLGAVASRVRCSAGAAGCWADPLGHTFCSLELRRLGAGLYCTTVWLNTATQATESEYEGVTSPLLRIYNEEGQHLTHAVVARAEPGARRLVAGGGCRLGAWAVWAPRPARLDAAAAGDLGARLRRLRARRAEPAAEEAEPGEAEVRAMCAPPAAECRLPAPLVGLALHEPSQSGRGPCVWAACSDGGVACVSLALQPLQYVRGPLVPAPAASHYAQPAATAQLVAWSLGAYSAEVRVVSTLTCAGGAVLAHAAPALCCMLAGEAAPDLTPDKSSDGSRDKSPDVTSELLVLAGEELYVWQSRATPQRSYLAE